mmetsp:Transcript_13419/g.15295  ORF Transcript_13419/g.15295 Transcript_13419/m.15295 type:complete len:107 (+) Transcript_13419:476-796(+)
MRKMVQTITVVGYPSCGYYQMSATLATQICAANSEYKLNLVPKPATQYRKWVREFTSTVEKHHTSSPSVFIGNEGKDYEKFIGGNDNFQSWARNNGLKKGGACIIL